VCIGVPVRVIEIYGREALVELDGVQQRINIELLNGVKRGEYVLLHAGCAIQRVDENKARYTLSLMEKLSGCNRV